MYRRGRHTPQYCQVCKKVGQISVILKESWPQYFSWPFILVKVVGQLVKRNDGKCLGTSLPVEIKHIGEDNECATQNSLVN